MRKTDDRKKVDQALLNQTKKESESIKLNYLWSF